MTYREDVRVSPPNFEKSVLNKFRTNPKKKKKKKSDNEITSPLIVKQKVPPIFLYDLCFQSFMLCYQYHLPPHVYQIGKSQEKNNNNKKGI